MVSMTAGMEYWNTTRGWLSGKEKDVEVMNRNERPRDADKRDNKADELAKSGEDVPEGNKKRK